ncbi:MAG: hypothetical protein HY235_28665 [Acidobacteria bacterium]|nr:hypothetical protein [Acidobacteriota bacterium]
MRLLEQVDHAIGVFCVEIAEYFLFLGGEVHAPGGAGCLQNLDGAAVEACEAELSLLRPLGDIGGLLRRGAGENREQYQHSESRPQTHGLPQEAVPRG